MLRAWRGKWTPRSTVSEFKKLGLTSPIEARSSGLRSRMARKFRPTLLDCAPDLREHIAGI